MSGIDERATLRRIAWRLLPLIALSYGVAYMDRVNISFAALQMNRDLGFSATVYGLGGGLFFLSYAALEVPSNMILARVGARVWIARIMLTWGLIAMSMAFVREAWQFYLVRFALGAAEAGFFPGVLYYVTQWFPEATRARAITRFYFAVPLSSAVMGAVAGSLLSLDGLAGLRGWQWPFLIQGFPPVLLAVVVFFALPDSPARVKWPSDEEKAWPTSRLAADAEGRHGDHPNPFRVMLQPVFAALVALNFLVLGSNYAFTLSAPELVKAATGLDAASVGYIAAVGSLLGVLVMLLIGWASDRTGHRGLFVALPLVAASAALAALALIGTPGVTMVGYAVFSACAVSAASLFYTLPGSVAHPRSAAVGLAAINSLGQFGSFVLPALFGRAKDLTGDYRLGVLVAAANLLIGAAIALTLGRKRTP